MEAKMTSDSDEEMLIVLDMQGIIESDWTSRIGHKCKIVGIDTAEPVLQLDHYIFCGEYQDVAGTMVLFEEEEILDTDDDDDLNPAETKDAFKYSYKFCTHKKLRLQRAFLTEKDTYIQDPSTASYIQDETEKGQSSSQADTSSQGQSSSQADDSLQGQSSSQADNSLQGQSSLQANDSSQGQSSSQADNCSQGQSSSKSDNSSQGQSSSKADNFCSALEANTFPDNKLSIENPAQCSSATVVEKQDVSKLVESLQQTDIQ